MIVTMLKKNKMFKSIPIIIIASFLIGFYNMSSLNIYGGIHDLSLSHFIIYTYGYLDYYSVKQLIPVIIWIFPQLLLIYLVGDSIYNNLKNKVIYVFTRTEKRFKWLLEQFMNLFFNVLVFCTLHFSATILVGLLNNVMIKSITDVVIILIVFLIYMFGSYLLLLLITTISLYIKITYSYIIVLTVFLFSIMMTGMIMEFLPSYLGIIKWFPSSHYFVSWYNYSLIIDIQNALNINYLEGLSLIFTLIYYFIFLLLIMFFSIRKINKMDIY